MGKEIDLPGMIGKICAIEMARRNCRVTIAGRSPDKEAAVADIKKIAGNDKVEFLKLNLLSLASVQAFAEDFISKNGELHILLNNTGVMMCPYELSEDGPETHFATNHVSHFYLTMLLLSLLEKSTSSCIINVTSKLHMLTSVKALNVEKLFHYCLTKEAKGIKNVYVNVAHPGIVRSDLLRHALEKETLVKRYSEDLISISTKDGARTSLYLATSPEVESKDIRGEYYVPFGKAGCPNPYSSSDKNAARLWALLKTF
ncbi:hypothetical protein BJV82DRAFT_646919 [Fennellomyces sp. T-0311]|nr:hypothetical protein BJV82DRAFT_646919 [Fennellomyces sp. T-0311]